jgi:hypothetical protein
MGGNLLVHTHLYCFTSRSNRIQNTPTSVHMLQGSSEAMYAWISVVTLWRLIGSLSGRVSDRVWSNAEL